MTPSLLRPVPDEPPRVVGYVRVSTAREAMISPELQRQAIEDYCARRGYILDEVIEDLDATGRNFTRKGVQKAIERVENFGVAVVVVWKFSRFGRNRKGWAINLDRVEAAGGRLESATEEVDADTSTGRFTRGLLAEVGAWESDRIGEQWEEAHAHRRRNGLPHNGAPRFGYVYHRAATRDIACPQGCPIGGCETGYAPDPDTAPVLEEMYVRYNSGNSVLKIAMWLNDKGMTSTKGRPWNQRNVRRYMDTGFAAGLLRIHDNTCRCAKPQACSKKVLAPGAHLPVISPEVWEAYQRNRKRRRKLPPRVETPVYPLAGLVRCGRCEGPMNAHPGRPNKRGPYVSGYLYSCARYEKSRNCEGTWVTRGKVEKRILEWLQEDVVDAEVEQRAELVVARAAAKATRDADRTRLLREAQKLEKALTQLTIDRATGLVPEVAYAGARDELQARQKEIGEALERLAEVDDVASTPPVEVAEGLIEEWNTLPPSVRREMLGKLIRAVTVVSYGRGKVEIDVIPAWRS